MRRRALGIGLPLVALLILGLILYNATLVDRRPPTVTRVSLSAPAGDAHRGQTLTAIDVEFSEPVRTASVETRFAITPHVAGAFRWDGGRTLIFTPSQRLPSATTFQVTIDAGFEDLAGNAATAAMDSWVFATTGPPVVTAITPTGSDVPVDTTVQLTFDRLMATSAVEGAMTISPATAYHASWSQQALDVSFDAPLAFGTTYTLAIGTGATDTDGSHLAAPFVASFTTVAAGLSVLSTAPADGVAGANPRGPIAIFFDAPIDTASTRDALVITPPVDGSVTVEEAAEDRPTTPATASPSTGALSGRVLVFTPTADLPAHTTYTVTLRPVVRSAIAAGQVAAGRTWSFTTGQSSSSAQNQVVFLTARGGVRNLWLMNPDGSNPRQLTSSLAPVTSYDVTVDGQTIAYSAGGVVRVVRVDGTDERIATDVGRFEYAPVFSPDGRSLILARRSVEGLDMGWWQIPTPGLGSGNERQLLPTGAPTVGSGGRAADGTDVIIPGVPRSGRAAFDGNGASALIVAAGGGLHLVGLTSDPPVLTDLSLRATSAPIWSPLDVAFLVGATGSANPTSGAWLVRPGGAVNRLVDDAGGVAVDGDGAMAVLRAVDDKGGPDGSPGHAGSPGPASSPGPAASNAQDVVPPLHIAYIRRPGSAPVAVTTAQDLSDRSPVFSPNGQEILFVRLTVAAAPKPAGIWVVDTDGRDPRQLTRDGADPRWLP